VDALRGDGAATFRSLGVELRPIPLADAIERGVDAERAATLATKGSPPRVLEVIRVTAGSPAASQLREGDLLVAADGAPLRRMLDVEALVGRPQVDLVVVRDRKETTLVVPTQALDARGIDRIVTWAGIVVHAPQYEVAQQQGVRLEGVYAAWMWYGSPSARYGIRPTRRIVEVDGKPTPDLDTFLSVVSAMQHRDSVRIETISLDGKVHVATLKLDLHYWPTTVIEWRDGAWTRRVVTPPG
jgi:S1-C subfamily serine protease